jgi:hypothetical protein
MLSVANIPIMLIVVMLNVIMLIAEAPLMLWQIKLKVFDSCKFIQVSLPFLGKATGWTKAQP